MHRDAACDSTELVADDGGIGNSGITISGNTITVDLNQTTSDLSNPGGFILIASASTFAINDGGDIKAFTSVCTHQQCNVNDFRSSEIRCPCHGSRYDSNGQVTVGPATRALQRFAVEQSGRIVTITK